MSSIVVESVTKRFGRHVALDRVSLDVHDQEFVVLLGPSGCGKTTLLNVIAGLETPESGSIRIDGELMNGLSPGSRDLGFVFQNYALYPSKTVEGNLAFALKFRPPPRDLRDSRQAFVRSRVREVAELLRIETLLNRYPSELSGGQRQRVAMGRALVRSPRAFLFDEPLSNLDAMLRVSVRQEIRDLHAELKTTMVYVTHDQTEAMTLGERIVIMNEGRILEVGTPEAIYDHPEWLFTARFVGTPPMNLVHGTLLEQEGQIALHASGETLLIPALVAGSYRSATGRPIVFGIRPEDVDFVDRFASSSKIRGKVVGREYLGRVWLDHVCVLGGRLIVESDREVRLGDELDLFVDMTKFHLFDEVTGRLIHAVA